MMEDENISWCLVWLIIPLLILIMSNSTIEIVELANTKVHVEMIWNLIFLFESSWIHHCQWQITYLREYVRVIESKIQNQKPFLEILVSTLLATLQTCNHQSPTHPSAGLVHFSCLRVWLAEVWWWRILVSVDHSDDSQDVVLELWKYFQSFDALQASAMLPAKYINSYAGWSPNLSPPLTRCVNNMIFLTLGYISLM